jgi:hypothetical protein
MKPEENIVWEYLLDRGFREVVYEPDGKVPPDFVVDKRIAIEVRRLNQTENAPAGGRPRGLEEVAIPLMARFGRFLPTLGPALAGESWYVMYGFQRPLLPWEQLANALTSALVAFRVDPSRQPTKLSVAPGFRIKLFRAGQTQAYPDFFVFGGCTDRDSGGFVLFQMQRNIIICVAEKTRKVASVRSRYPEWWLVLVDRIGYGVSDSDGERLRQLLDLNLNHSWDKIILVNPLDPTHGYEL